VKTCSSSCLSWLHFLKSWSLRQSRGGSHTILATTQAIAHGLFEAIDENDWESIERSKQLHDYLSATANKFPEIHGIYFNDAEGRARLNSVSFPAAPHSITDREFYHLLKNTAAPVVVSRPFKTRIAQPVEAFNVSYRLTNPDGSYRGSIGFAVSIQNLLSLFPARVHADEPGIASSIFREDGALLVRYPPAPEGSSTSLSSNTGLMNAIRSQNEYSSEGLSRTDGVWRIYSVQRVGDFPLFVGHSKSHETVYSRWLDNLKTYIAFFLSSTLILVTLAALVLRSYAQRNRDLVENSTQLENLVAERTQHLNRALEEKTALFREVNHRVKNNLQIIGSLVRLRNDSGDYSDLERRIEAMAMVHQLLYSQAEAAALNLRDYLPKLCSALHASLGQGVKLEAEADEVAIDLERGIPFALILSEAVTNALKYGRPTSGTPEVKVSLRRRGGDLILEVKDNGSGFEDEPKTGHTGFGQFLIRNLAVQLGATVDYLHDDGALFRMRFPAEERSA
jgi:two-component system, sensor histidine kinase PdtaS